MSDIDLVCDMCGEELAQSELKRYGKQFVIEVTPCPKCYIQVPEEIEEGGAEAANQFPGMQTLSNK